jgi:GTP-binding protein YchF
VKLSITGLSNSGKTTIFNALTGVDLETTVYPTIFSPEHEPHINIVKIPDKRVDKLSAIFDPKKTTYATVEYIDYLGMTPVSSGGDPKQNTSVFNLIKDADAIVQVVRAFEDESILHPSKTVDPLRDVRVFENDLMLGDLEFVEKRIERIELASKKGLKGDELEKNLLLKCREALENEIPLRNISFTKEEKTAMLHIQFLTTKPEIIVINIQENEINSEVTDKIAADIEAYFKENSPESCPLIIPLCGKIEMELTQLSQEESKAFLLDLGIAEPAMHKLCRVSYETLGLISFFTVGKDEVKAWTIRKDTEALKAAGKIHSDIERGFIRAEAVGYDDYIASDENMVTAREKGLVRLEGKTYIVKDGDIINFKFNV